MFQHPNARLAPRGRELLVSQVAGGERASGAARQMGASRQTASKRLARARRGEPMSDQPSRPRGLARLTPPDVEERVAAARSGLVAPARGRRRLRLRRPRGVAARRAQGRVGRVHGALRRLLRRFGRRRRARHDRQRARCRSGELNGLLESEGIRRVCTMPFSPWRNGRVERMDRALARECRYGRAWDGEAGRASALPAFIGRCNRERPRSACGGLPPMSRINNLLAHNS